MTEKRKIEMLARGFIPVASVGELPPGTGKVVTIRGREVGLFNSEGRLYAIENVCPHQQRPIGTMGFDGLRVTCLWHRLTFNLDTGRCLDAPHYQLHKYPVKVEDGEILVALVA